MAMLNANIVKQPAKNMIAHPLIRQALRYRLTTLAGLCLVTKRSFSNSHHIVMFFMA